MITICFEPCDINGPIYSVPVKVYKDGKLFLETDRHEDIKKVIGDDEWARWFGPFVLEIQANE